MTTAGDGENDGFMFAFDIDVSNSAITAVGMKALGINPGVAGVHPQPGYIYQEVEVPNCGVGRHISRYKPDEMTWDAI